MTAPGIVSAARRMIGTPFVHQGRTPGVALDCAGLLVCAARECGIEVADVAAYSIQPNSIEFVAAVQGSCDPIPLQALSPGDVVTMAIPMEQHLALVSCADPLRIIHAFSGLGRVVEHDVDAIWARRIRRYWRFRGRPS